MAQGRRISLESQRGWVLPVAAMVVVLLISALTGPSGHPFLTNAARSAAVVLLLGVARASMQMGHLWRVFARHDSIRADIAAAGGLGKRLSV